MVVAAFNTGAESWFDSSFEFLYGEGSSGKLTVSDSAGSSEAWGTFTVGETVTVLNVNNNGSFVTTNITGKFEGTFVRQGTEPIADRTYLVVSYEDPTYGTRYILIGHDSSGTSEFDAESDIVKENYFIPCFLPGTLVATPTGERKVEELAAGDLVLAIGGGGGAPRSGEMARAPRRLDSLRSCGEAHAGAFRRRIAGRRPAA